jgi:hypothetical protein
MAVRPFAASYRLLAMPWQQRCGDGKHQTRRACSHLRPEQAEPLEQRVQPATSLLELLFSPYNSLRCR